MLRYLYQGDPGQVLSVQETLNLLACTDIYQLEELQEICEYRLASILDCDNVLALLRQCLDAVPHAPHFRACVLDFLHQHKHLLNARLIAEFVASFATPNLVPADIRFLLLQANDALSASQWSF